MRLSLSTPPDDEERETLWSRITLVAGSNALGTVSEASLTLRKLAIVAILIAKHTRGAWEYTFSSKAPVPYRSRTIVALPKPKSGWF